MKIQCLVLLLTLSATPSWALYKCVAQGKTAFQEQPCELGQGQIVLKPQYVPETPSKNDAGRPTVRHAADDLEKERLRHETEYALRDKRVELVNYRNRCAAEVRQIADNRFGYNNNLAGATRSQAEATAANAHAAVCDTQVRQIEAEVQDLQRQCTERSCKPL